MTKVIRHLFLDALAPRRASMRGGLLSVVCCLLSIVHCPLSSHAQLYEQSVKEIIEALAADSLDKAEVLIKQTTSLDPMRESNAVLYRYLGGIYQRQGQCEKALDAYSKGIGLLPGADLLLDRASLYLQMNDLERAGADYSSVLELSPDDEEALFFRAYVFSSLRRYREARADYERLLELNPQHEDGRLGLALLNNKDGRPREAMEQLDALVEFFPTHARHLLARADIYLERRAYEEAMRDVRRAMELEPENPECYLTRASLYLAMKKKKLAQQDCKTAFRLGASAEQVAPLLGELK